MDYRVFEGNNLVNIVTADKAFIETYCEANGYTYEEIEREAEHFPEAAPSQLDIIEAQITYTAMMTDTLLEV